MSQSFYKYLVESLIIDRLKADRPGRGDKFVLTVEDDRHREQILKAFRENATPVTISDIFQPINDAVKETGFDTWEISLGADTPKLLLATDDDATEDYLNTIRNAVGLPGSLADYCVLYILKGSGLSSLITACQDLQGKLAPLSTDVISEKIESDLKNIAKDYEMPYLRQYLTSLSADIEDGSCDIFDFQNILSILQEEKLDGHFNDIGCFRDKLIYDSSFRIDDKKLAKRAETNHDVFQQVSIIMDSDALDDDKLVQLQKIFDDNTALEISRNHDWRSKDFTEILDSIELRNKVAKLMVHDLALADTSSNARIISHTIGKFTRSSTTYVIVCDPTPAPEAKVMISFNQKIKRKNSDCAVKDNVAVVTLRDKLVKVDWGTPGNTHAFVLRRLQCGSAFFKDLGNSFTISGDTLKFKVPDDADSITLGNGPEAAYLPLSGPLEWNDNCHVDIEAPGDEDEDTQTFSVDFGGSVVNIDLRYNVEKAVPPMGAPTGILETTYHPCRDCAEPCEKITDDEKVYTTNRSWRRYLQAEHEFLAKGCDALAIRQNDLTNAAEYEPMELELPAAVRKAFEAVKAYMRNDNTLPSLTPVTGELRTLYKEYVDAVNNVIRSIGENSVLTNAQLNIGRLGTVEHNGRLYLSPYHPLLVAYELEYYGQAHGDATVAAAKKLLSPLYLIPFLYHDGKAMQPYSDNSLAALRNWLAYERLTDMGQHNAGEVAAAMVEPRMSDFIRHFPYLFLDRQCPLIINSIGIPYDSYIIKGIVNFIIKHFKSGVQHIELHQYVYDIADDTFFEQLNRLSSTEQIVDKLQEIGANFDSDIEPRDIVHALFTNVTFYKHELTASGGGIGYCHISFYQMNTGDTLMSYSLDRSRSEVSMKGLITIPSTTNEGEYYVVGYGEKGSEPVASNILPVAGSLNTLYANSKISGEAFQTGISASKRFKFQSDSFLDEIYDKSNWVVFLNPEVDIKFFYKQKDVYLVHYTDQITLNPKYDSITITRKVEQYRNILRAPYENLGLSSSRFACFNDTMIKYFNCLNGSWMLSIVNKPQVQVREKMSLVAATLAMRKFLSRAGGIIWVPVSLEEILRATPSVGLKRDFIFTKSAIGASGPMSDDLLFMGLDASDPSDLKMHLYPVEVKCSSNSTSFSEKGDAQVSETFRQLQRNLTGEDSFIKRLYRAFFASQFLSNAEKLFANGLMAKGEYETLEQMRFRMLNVGYTIESWLADRKLGNAAVVSYFDQATHDISTAVKDDVAICHIHLTEKESYESIANPHSEVIAFLADDPIITDAATDAFLQNPPVLTAYSDDAESLEPAVEPAVPEETEATPEEPLVQEPEIQDTDETGPSSINIILGKNNGNDVVFEPNNTRRVSHPNMGIIGTMGMGKTQLARSIIAQFAKETDHNLGGNPVGMLVFDYKGDYNTPDFLEPAGGEVYKFNLPFNPLKLVVTPDRMMMNLPAITADGISDSLAKAYGLGLKQMATIKQVILEAYADRGITRDSATWGKIPPTMTDVVEKYFESYDANDKAYALFDKLRDYSIFSDNQADCVSLFEWLDRVRVIDLTPYPDDTKKVIVSLILDVFYAEMGRLGASMQADGYRQLRAMIMVDEAHQFIGKDFNALRKIISEGRAFGVGMILSTQNISDFKTSKENYAQFIASWTIHHVTSLTNQELATIFGAGNPDLEKYRAFINRAQIFDSVCKLGNNVRAIRDLPFFELIATDPRFG